jgi:SNF2 family DNA or RNA helicase
VKFKPRPYQDLIRDFALGRDRCNIFASPGMGKTSVGIEIFDSRRTMGEVKRCLVIAPKRVALTSWPEEVANWSESFGHLSIAAAVGGTEKRFLAVRSNPDILTINYDSVDWLLEQYGDEWPFDMVIADESTRLKGLRVSYQRTRRKDGSWTDEFIRGQGSVRARNLARIAHKKVKYWINATGSPAPNGLQDVWGQQWFVDAGRRLGSSFSAFERRWFRALPGGDGYSRIEPLPFAQAEIEALLRETSITVDAKDWFPLESVIERVVLVDLPSKARQHYRDMEKDLFTEVEQGEVEVFNAGAKAQKCLQIASGTLIYSDDREWVEIHDEKIEALKSIYNECNGENILVAYQHRADLARILKAFPKARELDAKPQTIADWNAGKIRMLVCHPASAGHGLSLQHGGRILVDFASGWNLEYDEQVIERLGPTRQAQSGYKRSVFRYRIVARDTIEHHSVLPRLKTKMSVQDSLKAAMKFRV